MIRAILACDDSWGIGKDNSLPWPHNAADLQWFKRTTQGSVVVMGRKTWDSLPVKPLPNRHNIVVSNSLIKLPDGVEKINTDIMKSRISYINKERDVWVIGGSTLVTSCLSIIDELWLSRITGFYNCDTFLPITLIQENYSLGLSELQNDVYVEIWRKR